MSGWYITANDIAHWTATNKREAEGLLPEIIERLIIESCDPLEINFRSKDEGSTSGWDGWLKVKSRGLFFPTGGSGWEIGTDYAINAKANSDYYNRGKNPLGLEVKKTVFVFATSRKWTKKDIWEREKRAEGIWRDIIGINASSLETWMRECPSTHLWFAKLVGKRISETWDLNESCNVLRKSIKNGLNPILFLHSRKKEQQCLLNALSEKPSVIRVSAQNQLDAYGFIVFTLENEKLFIPRTLIIKNQSAWDWIMGYSHSLILIPDDFTPKNLGKAISSGHHVIIPTDFSEERDSKLILNKMSRNNRIESLKLIGFSDSQADNIYHDTKGYLMPILRHHHLCPVDSLTPVWVEKVNTDILFAALFASNWDTNNNNDKDILARLSGMQYNEFEKALFDLELKSDTPIRFIGHIWQIISKIDLWLLIAAKMNDHHINRLGEVIEDVVLEPDPAYELNPDERNFAALKGAIPKYSKELKYGLSDSLAVLSAYGDDYSYHIGGKKPSQIVKSWLIKMFQISSGTQFWYSLGQSLLPLAEAAPVEFLSTVERDSEGEEPSLKNLFLDEGSGIFSGCPHASLLWSLELVSWDISNLTRVCKILARLSEIDPGGRYSNRPFESLQSIMCGWLNNTTASHDDRLKIIKHVLLVEFPNITWRLMVSLISRNNTVGSFIHKPKYRDWHELVKERPLRREYLLFIT